MHRFAFLLVTFLFLQGTALSQTVTQGTSFCISGTSTGTNFSWFIDLNNNGLIEVTDAFENVVVNTVPNGQNASMLAAAFVASVNGNLAAVLTGTSAAVATPTNCFTITTGNHCAGGFNDGYACSVNTQCPGASCVPPVPPELYVGPPSNPSSCHVTTGCTYNPTISKVALIPSNVPGLNVWGSLILILTMLTAGIYRTRRKWTPRTR